MGATCWCFFYIVCSCESLKTDVYPTWAHSVKLLRGGGGLGPEHRIPMLARLVDSTFTYADIGTQQGFSHLNMEFLCRQDQKCRRSHRLTWECHDGFYAFLCQIYIMSYQIMTKDSKASTRPGGTQLLVESKRKCQSQNTLPDGIC